MKAKLLCILIALLLLLSGCKAPAEEKETAAIDEYITETPKEESGAEEDLAENDIFSNAYKDYFVCRFEFLYKSTVLHRYNRAYYEALLGEEFTVNDVSDGVNDESEEIYIVSAVTSSKEAFQNALCSIGEDRNIKTLTLEYSAHRIKKDETNPALPKVTLESEVQPWKEEFLYVRDNYRAYVQGEADVSVVLKDMRLFSLSDFKEFPLSYIAVYTKSSFPDTWIRMYSDEILNQGEKEMNALQSVNERLGSNLRFFDYVTEGA